jgi:outer membrane lipoprotein carrier protein
MKLLLTLFSILFVSLHANIALPSSFSTNFQQIITNDQGKVINYKGHIYFQDLVETLADDLGKEQSYTRSLFKWNYLSPSKKEVCTDGFQLTVVDHDLEQIANYLVDENINLKEILSVAKEITTTDYKATYKDIEYLITLDSKRQLLKIIYVDNLENSVKILFSNMSYNKTINRRLLECTAPKEYDVIKG